MPFALFHHQRESVGDPVMNTRANAAAARRKVLWRWPGWPALTPSLLTLGGGATVVHLGTFSKTLCPGLRLGYVVAPQAVLEKYVLLKQSADLHTSTLTQLMAASYLACGELDANLAAVIGEPQVIGAGGTAGRVRARHHPRGNPVSNRCATRPEFPRFSPVRRCAATS